MPKIITKYRGFTATDLKTRADIPIQANMVVSGDTVICSDITISQIRSAINAADTNLSALARHDNVNVWSGFGPTIRSVGNYGWYKVLENSKPVGDYSMGSFAGYNHTAVTPGWNGTGKTAAQKDVWINPNTKPWVFSDIILGEVRHEDADGVILVAFNSSSGITAYGEDAFPELLTENVYLLANSINNISTTQTWTLRSYLKSGYISGSTDIESAILYRCPNVDDAVVTIKIKQATTVDTTADSPWVVSGSITFSLTTGYYTITNIYSPESYDNVLILGAIYNWLGDEVGSVDLYNAAYTAYDYINTSGYVGMANIPNYGYSVTLSFLFFQGPE
jgi:hypothetical protein